MGEGATDAGDVMSHKFKVGQPVRRALAVSSASNGVGEVFEVTRLMPEDRSGEPSYRVRTSGGERAMRESELVAAQR
jgi:hypothetical protein